MCITNWVNAFYWDQNSINFGICYLFICFIRKILVFDFKFSQSTVREDSKN